MERLGNFARSLVISTIVSATAGCVPDGTQSARDLISSPDLDESHLVDCPAPRNVEAQRVQDEISGRVFGVTVDAFLTFVGRNPLTVRLEGAAPGMDFTQSAEVTMDCSGMVSIPRVVMGLPIDASVPNIDRARLSLMPGRQCKTQMLYFSVAAPLGGDGTFQKPYELPSLPTQKLPVSGCFDQ